MHRDVDVKRKWHSISRDILISTISEPAPAAEALEEKTSFETWLRLRKEKGLSPKKAQAVMLLSIKQLTAGH